MPVRAVRRPPKGEVGKVMMAPMVDVVFQLLIFFLIASEVRPTEADFDANLPAGSGPRDAKVPPKEAYRVYLKPMDAQCSNVEVSINDDVLGPAPQGFQVLVARLKSVTKKENMLLVIDGEPNVKVQFITYALDAAVDAQVPSITFGKPKGGTSK